jgi:ubiquinone/menaquinone biosynthesis C-methylase UbiE
VQIEAWDKVASEANFNLEIDLPKFIEHIPSEERILDYGCGYGRITEILFKKGYINIIGVDSSGEMIRRAGLEHPHISLQKTEGSKLSYPNSTFGAVVICAVLTCLPEQKQKVDVLSEIKRVLRPGGILHLVEFCSESNNVFTSKMGVVMQHQTPKELRSLLSTFTELSTIVTKTKTMSSNNAKAFSYFGQNT